MIEQGHLRNREAVEPDFHRGMVDTCFKFLDLMDRGQVHVQPDIGRVGASQRRGAYVRLREAAAASEHRVAGQPGADIRSWTGACFVELPSR